MELIEVEAFVAIAEVGGFSRAANLLRVSQPAISRRIELLERELGAPLFERIRAGATLTDAGRAFLPHAQQLLAAARDGAAAVQALRDEGGGTLTLALLGTLATSDLLPRLRAFRDAYPRLRLELRTARSDEVSALVRQGDAQLGLRYFADPRANIVSRLVANEPLLVVGAAHSRLVAEGLSDPAGLRGVPWFGFSGPANEPYIRLVTRQLAANGLDDADVTGIDSLTAQKRLIEADFGVGMLPASSVEEELRLGSLQRLDLPTLETHVPVMLIHRPTPLSAAAELLVAALTADHPPNP
jgi:DNA-binding transcriptional LysR family regulator